MTKLINGLVIFAIIVILIALLVPAVKYARDAVNQAEARKQLDIDNTSNLRDKTNNLLLEVKKLEKCIEALKEQIKNLESKEDFF